MSAQNVDRATNKNKLRRARQAQSRPKRQPILHINPPSSRTRYTGSMSQPARDKKSIVDTFAQSERIKATQTKDYLENMLMPRQAFGQVKAAAQKTSRFLATAVFDVPPNPSGLGAIIFDTNPMYPIRYLKELSAATTFQSKTSESMHHITANNSLRVDVSPPLLGDGEIVKPEAYNGGFHYENGGVRSGGFRYKGEFTGDVIITIRNNQSTARDVGITVKNWSSEAAYTGQIATLNIAGNSEGTHTTTLAGSTAYGLSIGIGPKAGDVWTDVSYDIRSVTATSTATTAWVPLGFIGIAPGTTIAKQLLGDASSFAVTAADCLVSNYNNQFVANGMLSMMEIPPQSYDSLPSDPQSLINYVSSTSYTQRMVSTGLKDGGHYSWAPQKPEDVELHPIPTDNTYFLYGDHNRAGALFAFASQDESHQKLVVTVNMNIEFISNEKVVPPRVCPHNIVLFSHWMAFLAENNRFSSNAGHIRKVAGLTKNFLKSEEGKQMLSFLGKSALAALSLL